jgi:cold shock protein
VAAVWPDPLGLSLLPLAAGLISLRRNIGGDIGQRYCEMVQPDKGYGFIQPVGGGRDVFVHISAVERSGLSTLNGGQSVEFEEVENRGKTSAENLKVAR